MQKINRTKDNSEQKKNENKREPGTKEELLKVQKRTFTIDCTKEEEELLSI